MKKIFFNSYTKGNMESLIEYFNKNIKDKNIEIIYKDNYLVRNDKIKRKLLRIKEFLKSYDLIVSDYSTSLYKRAKKGIYMSHGYGTKLTPGKEELNNRKVMNSYKLMRENTDYVITLSDRDETYFWKHDILNSLKSPKYIPLGLPRNDIFFNDDYIQHCNIDIRKKLNLGENKIALYCPTWRNYRTREDEIFSIKELEKLNKSLKEKSWILLIRQHYLSNIMDRNDIKDMSNIVIADFDIEESTQKLLCAVDMLITDYSSIYVDYLILNRPIAFLPYDLNEYSKVRGLAIDYNNCEEVPGPQFQNLSDIVKYIDNIENSNDEYEEYREKARKIFYTNLDGDSCKRIWELIYEII